MDLGLRGRACIVTGGSRGIGLRVAELLCAEQAHVLIVGRNQSALDEAVASCGGEPRAAGLSLDVTGAQAGEQAVAACRERFGRLDALVNCAGTSSVKALDELEDRDWQEQWDLNVMASMRLMRAAAPVMADAGWGRVVNVSSSSGKRPGQRNVAYSVAKAAQLSLSRAYADAYAGQGVLVNAVTPGPVGTELWLAPGGMADQTAQARGITREEALEAASASVPRGELGAPEEIAAVIVFLCSEAAANVAGAAWSVDGGAVPVIL